MDILEIVRVGLGVEFDEEFTREGAFLDNKVNQFRFVKWNINHGDRTMLQYNFDGIWWNLHSNQDYNEDLGLFIGCQNAIVKVPFKPQRGNRIYYVATDGEVSYDNFYSDEERSLLLYKIGNCYRNENAAIKDRDKWVTYYNDIQKSLE